MAKRKKLYQKDGVHYIDSVLNANKNLDWVQRLYQQNPKSLQIPGQPGLSTHFMESSDGKVYPTVVNDSKGLRYLGDKARDYADSTKTAIVFPTDKQAQWFGKNYKKGTGVLKGFQNGGWNDDEADQVNPLKELGTAPVPAATTKVAPLPRSLYIPPEKAFKSEPEQKVQKQDLFQRLTTPLQRLDSINEAAWAEHRKVVQSPHIEQGLDYDYNKNSPNSLRLTSGKFRNAIVPKPLIKELYQAARKVGIDPMDLIALAGQESTFGGDTGQSADYVRYKKDLVSGWNLEEEYNPKDFRAFLADKKVPGVSVTKDFHGWTYDITDTATLEKYLDKHPELVDQYEKTLAAQKKIPKDFNYYEAAGKKIKKEGIKKYNPGDKNYEGDVLNSRNLLQQDAPLQGYLKELDQEEAAVKKKTLEKTIKAPTGDLGFQGGGILKQDFMRRKYQDGGAKKLKPQPGTGTVLQQDPQTTLKNWTNLYLPVAGKVDPLIDYEAKGKRSRAEYAYRTAAGDMATLEGRSIPPMTRQLKELQSKLLAAPNDEIKGLLKSNTALQALSNKPSNITWREAYKYYNHIDSLKNVGYTFQDGGQLNQDAMNNLKPDANYFKSGGIHIKKSHRGLLHKNLGVAKGKKIPASKLTIHAGDSPALKKRKQFAINAKKWHHEDGGLIPSYEVGGTYNGNYTDMNAVSAQHMQANTYPVKKNKNLKKHFWGGGAMGGGGGMGGAQPNWKVGESWQAGSQNAGAVSAGLSTGSGIVDALAPADQYGVRSSGADIGGSALKGASTGLQTAGPWGALAGAAIGAVVGGIKHNAAVKKKRKALEGLARVTNAQNLHESEALLANYDNMGTGIKSFAAGGSHPHGGLHPAIPMKLVNGKWLVSAPGGYGNDGDYHFTDRSFLVERDQNNKNLKAGYQKGGTKLSVDTTGLHKNPYRNKTTQEVQSYMKGNLEYSLQNPSDSVAVNKQHAKLKQVLEYKKQMKGKAGYQGGGMAPGGADVSGGNLQPISNNAYEVKGDNPQATDDVQFQDAYVDHGEVLKPGVEGTQIFSDHLTLPGTKTTFAKAAKKLEKSKSIKGNVNPNQDALIESKLKALFHTQQRLNDNSQGESTEEAVQPAGEVPGRGMSEGNMFKMGGLSPGSVTYHDINPKRIGSLAKEAMATGVISRKYYHAGGTMAEKLFEVPGFKKELKTEPGHGKGAATFQGGGTYVEDQTLQKYPFNEMAGPSKPKVLPPTWETPSQITSANKTFMNANYPWRDSSQPITTSLRKRREFDKAQQLMAIERERFPGRKSLMGEETRSFNVQNIHGMNSYPYTGKYGGGGVGQGYAKGGLRKYWGGGVDTSDLYAYPVNPLNPRDTMPQGRTGVDTGALGATPVNPLSSPAYKPITNPAPAGQITAGGGSKFDWNSAAGLAASLASNVHNAMALRNMPDVAQVSLAKGPKLKKLDYSDQKAMLREGLNTAIKAGNRNSTMRQAQEGSQAASLSEYTRGVNQMHGDVNRTNAQIGNEEAAMGWRNELNNNQISNQYRRDQQSRLSAIMSGESANLADVGNKVQGFIGQSNAMKLDQQKLDMNLAQLELSAPGSGYRHLDTLGYTKEEADQIMARVNVKKGQISPQVKSKNGAFLLTKKPLSYKMGGRLRRVC